MEDMLDTKNSKKWVSKTVTVKVTNLVCGRVDIHKNMQRDEITWLTANPNLQVEIVEAGRFKDKEE